MNPSKRDEDYDFLSPWRAVEFRAGMQRGLTKTFFTLTKDSYRETWKYCIKHDPEGGGEIAVTGEEILLETAKEKAVEVARLLPR